MRSTRNSAPRSKTAAHAISRGKFDEALPVGSENLRLTPITQEFLAAVSNYSAYFTKYFGAGKRLRP